MRTLIFDEKISGHHLEYLHHYYMGAMERPQEEFVFCLEDSFLDQKDKYNWPEAKNVSVRFMASSELEDIRNTRGFRYRLRMSKLIARKAKELNANRVILTNFMYLIPFLLFVMPRDIRVRGIIYRIFLHTKDKVSKLRYAVEILLYWLMAHSSVMEKVYILNDWKSVEMLNDKLHTSKFNFLPDPVPEVDKSKLVDLRSQYCIPVENKVFFHFGGLTQRKGTLEILKAIDMSSEDVLSDKTFVFAGRIYQEMHDEFYQLLGEAKEKAQILVFDTFCEYDFLYNMCYTCDVILMPYQQTELSSGILGYAAVFHKPVIGPSDGLLGCLIKQNNLGYPVNSVSASSLSEVFSKEVICCPNSYARKNDVKEFITIILD